MIVKVELVPRRFSTKFLLPLYIQAIKFNDMPNLLIEICCEPIWAYSLIKA
jgi:hypothetical protein